MELKQALQKLEKSAQFKKWKKTHAEAFLAHAFVMLDEANKDIVQFGFFDSKSDMMTPFMVEPKKISALPESEVFKSNQAITPLVMEHVQLTDEKALEIANEFRNKNYSAELPIKTFFIVQHLDIGCVFNITFFTKSLKTLNLKISVVDGKILKHSLESLISDMK
jgi:hypothetical protein